MTGRRNTNKTKSWSGAKRQEREQQQGLAQECDKKEGELP